MDRKALGGLPGLIAASSQPDDAEGAPAVKGFAEMYDNAMRAGSNKMMYAGTMEPDVFERAVRRDPSLRNNKVFIEVHGGRARKATNEMEPPAVGRHIENLLHSGETRVLPNFPGRNFPNQRKGNVLPERWEKRCFAFYGGRKRRRDAENVVSAGLREEEMY